MVGCGCFFCRRMIDTSNAPLYCSNLMLGNGTKGKREARTEVKGRRKYWMGQRCKMPVLFLLASVLRSRTCGSPSFVSLSPWPLVHLFVLDGSCPFVASNGGGTCFCFPRLGHMLLVSTKWIPTPWEVSFFLLSFCFSVWKYPSETSPGSLPLTHRTNGSHKGCKDIGMDQSAMWLECAWSTCKEGTHVAGCYRIHPIGIGYSCFPI